MTAEFDLRSAQEQAPITSSPFHTWSFPNGTPWTEFHRVVGGGYLLRFPGLADFEISADALAITCVPTPYVSDETAKHIFINQVRPLVLSELGNLVFHASAVEVGTNAVAFVGESGRGKSTLAASFAVNGHRFLTDDGLVVEQDVEGFMALPSVPSIRLWEDSEAALIPPAARRAPLMHYTAKVRFLADEDLMFCDTARPLRRVYFLGDGSAARLLMQRLSPPETLVEWVKHSFLLDIEERARLSLHFDQVAALASQPIHYRLDFPRRYEELDAVRQAILTHVSESDAEV